MDVYRSDAVREEEQRALVKATVEATLAVVLWNLQRNVGNCVNLSFPLVQETLTTLTERSDEVTDFVLRSVKTKL